MIRKVPLIVILGSTGVGKTKLSIELAQKFGGEIISADSMQLYKGLDIATAKATTDEQAAAPHHMLSVIEPGQPFTVVHFRDTVLPIVNDLLHRKTKVPIVVGGTNYYIESLLWKILISSADRGLSDTSDSDGEEIYSTKTVPPRILEASSTDPSLKISSEDFYAQSSEFLHSTLQRLDPVMAARLHPNNKRKIIRALDYFAETSLPLSMEIQKQREMAGGSTLGGPLRYEHTILFWLRCEQDVLDRRLDTRVDGMVAQGLLREIRDFHNTFSSKIENIDFTKGVLQIIGYKEFVRYLNQFDEATDQEIQDYIASGSCGAKPEGLVVLEQCLEELKLVTRRYSKKQKKWINNRFLGNSSRLVPPLYKLDTTDPTKWADTVYGPAVDVIEAYMHDVPIPMRPSDKLKTAREGLDNEVSKTCETCQRVFVGEYQYILHMKSNKHKKMVTRACKQKKRDKEMQT